MKINNTIQNLINAVKDDNKQQIAKCKQDLIHPDDGCYFAIYKKYKDRWMFTGKLFESRTEAKDEMEKENYRRKKYNNSIFQDIDIRRVVVHETDISEYL